MTASTAQKGVVEFIPIYCWVLFPSKRIWSSCSVNQRHFDSDDTQMHVTLRPNDLTGIARKLHVNIQMTQNVLHLSQLRGSRIFPASSSRQDRSSESLEVRMKVKPLL